MRTLTKLSAWFAVVSAAASFAPADRPGIHIPAGRSVGFNWYLNDGAGYRWDIAANGQISDGANDAYDGGMQLRLSGSYFSSSDAGRLSADGREVEIGPWKANNLQVYRRIYIDPKLGYCRWIDIFENPGPETASVSAQYYTNLGGTVEEVYSTSGKPDVSGQDWGVVTGSSSSSSRPAIVHVFASKGAQVRPRFRYTKNNDSVYYDFSLKVPPGKAVATCVFHAQRRPLAEARKFLDEFKPRNELTKVPAELRRIIVNMGGATLVLGNIDLPRHEKYDLAVLRNENELLGTILNERFDVETFYGRLELGADRVVGINLPAPDDPYVQVVLVDGQVLSGRLLNAPLRIRLTNGNEMSLPPSKLAAATFALSPERPGDIKLTNPTIMLRSGQQLYFQKEDLDCTYQTQYGTVKLDGDDLRSLHFDTPEGGLHRARFRNGSVLSGLLAADALKLRLDLGPTLNIRRHLAVQCAFPVEETDSAELSEVTLRNDDVLFGRIEEELLTVTTQYGDITVKPAEVAELETPEEGALGQVRIKLHSGTNVTGKLVGDTIRFQMVPGPRLPVFIGHVVKIACPKPQLPATQPATRPTSPDAGGENAPEREEAMPELPGGTSTRPAAPPAPTTRPRPRTATKDEPLKAAASASESDAARLKQIGMEIAQLREDIAKLDAMAKLLAAERDQATKAGDEKRAAQALAKVKVLQEKIASLQKQLAASLDKARPRQ